MKILVIIVTYNGKKWYSECFDSLRNSTVPLSIIVIDNNSTDGTCEYIKQNYPEIILIDNNENLGFGRANNIGIEFAIKNKFDFVFLLNQDAWINPNTIENLCYIMETNPKLGIISPMQFNRTGKVLDRNFKILLNKKRNKRNSLNSEVQSVKFIMAAIWLIRFECIIKVGLFDSVFSHYGEDNDFSNRVIYHGYEVGVAKNVLGFHDREYRLMTEKEILKVKFAGILSILMDINLNFIVAVLKSLITLIKVVLMHRSLLSLKLSIKQIFNFFKQRRLILEHRNINQNSYIN